MFILVSFINPVDWTVFFAPFPWETKAWKITWRENMAQWKNHGLWSRTVWYSICAPHFLLLIFPFYGKHLEFYFPSFMEWWYPKFWCNSESRIKLIEPKIHSFSKLLLKFYNVVYVISCWTHKSKQDTVHAL